MDNNGIPSADKGTLAEAPQDLYETRSEKGEPAVHATRTVVQIQNLVAELPFSSTDEVSFTR